MRKNGNKTISLSLELTLLFIGLTFFTFFLCWVLNCALSGKFYTYSKEKKIKEVYEELNQEFNSNDIGSEKFALRMSYLCNVNNMDLVISDSDSNTRFSTMWDAAPVIEQLREIILTARDKSADIIEESDSYTICTVRDCCMKGDYIVMWGNLDEDNFFMIRTPLESVREYAKLSNTFLLYVGIFSVVLSCLIVCVVSVKVSKPIKELSEIAREVSELKFEKIFNSRGACEITMLGRDINAMSEKLKSTISDLKSVNLELQKDVEARDQADKRRAEFISDISHELKTPIALIQGYAEGLKEGIIEDKENRDYYCDVIVDETQKMNHLVKRLILLNQVESGADAMTMVRFDLNALISNCIHSYALLTDEQGIKVLFDNTPGLFVWADEYRTEEVFRNYFSNAVHYCKGEKEIRIRSELTEGHIKIGVFNTGDPIPEEHMGKLWDKFYKVDKSRSREYGGSGLGLSIVKAIMDSMNGRYGAINYDDGVEFWFELETK
ncbi:MAG: HAMP domain-containing histidine kinase [Lachnospiraceae bacterium]|nr:HAMP domain-containing histidine kinase [Lachnospiraceae bacterium]